LKKFSLFLRHAARPFFTLLLLLTLSFSTVPRPLTGVAAASSLQSPNLLQNPGFEGDYFAWSGINEIQVAHGWTPYWWEQPDRDPPFFRPEYKRAVAAQFPNRVLSGESAQQWFTFHASHWAGMYQQVFNVTPGQRYRFSIWAQVWSSIESNPPTVSVNPANPRLRVGIDPTGNWQAGAGTVVWSGEGAMSNHVDRWGEISVEAVAQNNLITVFMRTNPDFATKHNDMYWDNASLIAIEPVPPTPAPVTDTPPATATLPPPTATLPPPTATLPPPTATLPPPTATPPPPTATLPPLPTATAVATVRAPATETAVPTDTPLPPTPTLLPPTAVATEIAALPATLPPPSATPLPVAPQPADNNNVVTVAVVALLGLLLVLGLLWWRRSATP
jgi:hypothetical protein